MGKGMKAGKKKKPGGGANMQKQLAQMQKVQQQMDEVQTEIEQMETTATSGGGAVSVKVTGSKQVKEITINCQLVCMTRQEQGGKRRPVPPAKGRNLPRHQGLEAFDSEV